MPSLRTAADTASELGKDAKESAEKVGRMLDDAKDQTAGALHTAASSVRNTGRQTSEAIDGVTAGVADRLDATASYVDNQELSDVFDGLRKFARRHLAGALVFATAAGFLAGLALHRAAHTCEKTSEKA